MTSPRNGVQEVILHRVTLKSVLKHVHQAVATHVTVATVTTVTATTSAINSVLNDVHQVAVHVVIVTIIVVHVAAGQVVDDCH